MHVSKHLMWQELNFNWANQMGLTLRDLDTTIILSMDISFITILLWFWLETYLYQGYALL